MPPHAGVAGIAERDNEIDAVGRPDARHDRGVPELSIMLQIAGAVLND